MKETKYIRKGKTIFEGVGVYGEFEYINEAKRHSWKLQIANDGALGRGALRLNK